MQPTNVTCCCISEELSSDEENFFEDDELALEILSYQSLNNGYQNNTFTSRGQTHYYVSPIVILNATL